MRLLVTGASGFLGGHAVERFVEAGHDVRAMVRRGSDAALLSELGVELANGDVTDPSSLRAAVRDVDAVVHMAAYYTFSGNRALYEAVNVKGTRDLALASLQNGVSRFVHCSSTEALGPVGTPCAGEDSTPRPTYDYGRSKLESERVVKGLGSEGLEYTILRPTGIYGPRNVNDVSFWTIVSYARNDLGTRFLVGSGKNLVQFCHVRDVVKGFELALAKPERAIGKVYHVSDGRAYTYREVYSILSELADRRMPRFSIAAPVAKALMLPLIAIKKMTGSENFLYNLSTIDSVTSDRSYSIERITQDLGYIPEHDLRSGLAETLRWYAENGFL